MTPIDRAARLLIKTMREAAARRRPVQPRDRRPGGVGSCNGFAAFGLVETLAPFPCPSFVRSCSTFIDGRCQRFERSSRPTDSWRQIIDEPGAYREETATAML